MKKVKVAKRGIQEADKIIGLRIRARRHEFGMSQEELGHKLGISFQQIQKYEKGANRVTTGRLVQVCEALKCSVTDLAAGLSGRAAKITPESTFAASRDGVAIIRAMSMVEDVVVRRHIIHLVESLAA